MAIRPSALYPRLDWYFARGFLTLFLVCFTSMVSLVAVADLFQKTDDFANYAERSGQGLSAMLSLLAHYYLVFAPGLVLRWLLPVVAVLAGVIAATAASLHNEFTVLRATGVSVRRALLAFLIPTLLIGLLAEGGRDFYLPGLLRQTHRILTQLKPRGAQPLALVIHDGAELQSLSLGNFDEDGRAYNLRLERRAPGGGQANDNFSAYTAAVAALQPRVTVDAGDSDRHELQWMPQESGQIRQYGKYKRDVKDWTEPLPTYVTPAMLERQSLGVAILTWADLRRLAPEESDMRLEMHRRLSEPFCSAVILLLALCFVLRSTVRGDAPSFILNVVCGLVICGLFYVIRIGLLSLGEVETLPPFLAAWLPILLGGGLGGWYYHRLEA